MEGYVELHAQSAFSFLRGASQPTALVEQALAIGLPALALCDRDGFYGSPRFWMATEGTGLRAIYGCELTLEDGTALPLLVRNTAGYCEPVPAAFADLLEMLRQRQHAPAGMHAPPLAVENADDKRYRRRKNRPVGLLGNRENPGRRGAKSRLSRRTPFERMAAIHEVLKGGAARTGVELANETGSSEAMVSRDLVFMQIRLGLPVRYRPELSAYAYTGPVDDVENTARIHERLVTGEELAAALNLPAGRHIEVLRRRRKIPFIILGSRTIRYSIADCVDALKQQPPAKKNHAKKTLTTELKAH